MNGYELAAALRSRPAHARDRAGRADRLRPRPDRKRALDAGFDEHLVKPVELDALLTTLNRLLGRDAAVAG